LRNLLRNEKTTIALPLILTAVICIVTNLASSPAALVCIALLILVLMRLGLVEFLILSFINGLFGNTTATLDASAWYFAYGFAVFVLFAALVLCAFRTSLGGRPSSPLPNLMIKWIVAGSATTYRIFDIYHLCLCPRESNKTQNSGRINYKYIIYSRYRIACT
jgi:hypothetical protein